MSWFIAAPLLPTPMIIAGIIWSLALGFAAGNYACSIVHRLPRARGILEKKPYCGECGTMLATKDLFPVISALLLRHKCRYCGAPIPQSHFWTEVLVGLLFVLCFLNFNFSETYLLVALLGTWLIILASIHANEGKLMWQPLLAILVVGMVLRSVTDWTIYGFVSGGFAGLVVGMLIWRKQVKKVGHVYSLPDGAKLFVLAGVCLGLKGFVLFLGLFAIFLFLSQILLRLRVLPITVPYGFAVTLVALFPQALTLLALKAWLS